MAVPVPPAATRGFSKTDCDVQVLLCLQRIKVRANKLESVIGTSRASVLDLLCKNSAASNELAYVRVEKVLQECNTLKASSRGQVQQKLPPHTYCIQYTCCNCMTGPALQGNRGVVSRLNDDAGLRAVESLPRAHQGLHRAAEQSHGGTCEHVSSVSSSRHG